MALADFKNGLAGLFGVHSSSSASAGDAAERAFKHTLCWDLPADANATANVAAEYFWTTETAVTLKSVTIIPNAAGALNATNYATFNVGTGDGAGTAPTTCATAGTSATNMAAGVPFDLTISTAGVSAGEVLSFAVVKSGAGGLDIPAGTLVVAMEEV